MSHCVFSLLLIFGFQMLSFSSCETLLCCCLIFSVTLLKQPQPFSHRQVIYLHTTRNDVHVRRFLSGIVDCNSEENILVWERFTRPSIIFGVSLEEMMGGERSSSTVFFYSHSPPTLVNFQYIRARLFLRRMYNIDGKQRENVARLVWLMQMAEYTYTIP